MQLIADLHIHSRFSRATSRNLDFVALHRAAQHKGIDLVGTGDFTHPGWMAEIEEQLEPAEEGLFRLKPALARAASEGLPPSCLREVRFVLQVEISNIYKKADRTRKNHNLVYVPTLEAAHRFSEKLGAIGNIKSDGRPILGLDARDLLEITLETDPQAFLIPAHIWTPWFSMLGSKSGFDSIEECFGDLAGHIFAAETGLSSDPAMNWRLSQLDHLRLVSNSDAHSAAKLGREANLFDIELSFPALLESLKTGRGFNGTIEFYPEEGKYHLDGHRKCGVRLEPEETHRYDGRCPECGGKLTVGVMSRVHDLADRPAGSRPDEVSPFVNLVPLDETVGEVLGAGPQTKKVQALLERLRSALGPELAILKDLPLEEIEHAGGAPTAEAIKRIRQGTLSVDAGFDGEFGKVRIFSPGERDHLVGQMTFLKTAKSDSRPKKRTAPSPKTERAPDPQPLPEADSIAFSPETPLAGLDADQLAAAQTETGPLLVVAGPGTGKTRTLVCRIAHLVQQGIVDPAEVLAIAFTNQAAEELKQRIGRAIPGASDRAPRVATFHGFGRSVIKALSGEEPELVEEEQRLALIKRAAGEEVTDRQAGQLLSKISLAKQSLEPETALGDQPELSAVYERYEQLLVENGLMDVDDLVLKAHRLLAADSEAAQQMARRYKSISVDEYQDVNDVQAALIKQLSPTGESLMAIGDPDQAIYGFRGARPGHFLRFAQAYSGAQIVSLKTSYRLTHQVLAVARSVLPEGKTSGNGLSASRLGKSVELIACPTAKSEAEQILVRLERLLGGTSYFAVDSGRGDHGEELPIGFGDVAVLSRTKAQRREIRVALERSSVPCHSVGEGEPHDPRSEKVALMTMHAAKGREFEVVFITGVEPGLMPLDLAGISGKPNEERRLLYVAITRAKTLAVISYAGQRTLFGKRLDGGPSPFLAQLPAKAIQRQRPAMPQKKAPDPQLKLF